MYVITMYDFDTAKDLFEKAINDRITENDIDIIISWPVAEASVLFACADKVRRHFLSNAIHPCAIMNIKSGGCSENCAFCSQSAHNSAKVSVQALSSKEEIIAAYETACENDLAFGVVSSGKKLSSEEIETVAAALKECKDRFGNSTHASLGILTGDEFSMLRDAGVVCYNHNLETSRRYFEEIVTTHSYDQRIETVKLAKKAGMRTCCGGIFGMGETWEDRKALCLELKDLDVDTIPLNFLNPVPGTSVEAPKESPLEFLKIISLFRLVHPRKSIKVCGGREVHLGKLQGLMFYAGANGDISGDYLTTPGDSVESDDEIIGMLGLEKTRDQ